MISEKPWRLDAVIRLFLSVIGTLCFGILVSALLEKALKGLSAVHRDFCEMVTMIIFFQGAALVWIAFFLRASNISWRNAFGLRPSSRLRTVGYGLLVGLLILPIALLLQWVSENLMELTGIKPVAEAAVEAMQNPALTLPEKITFGIFAAGLAPIVEETLFRGILYPTIKQMGFPKLALWGTSMLFAVMHFNVETFIPLTFLATIFVYLYESSGSLLAPIAAHSVFNLSNVLILFFDKQISDYLNSLTRALHHS